MIEMGIEQLIGTVGFPIAAFLLMWRTHTTTLTKMTEALNELRECILEITHDKRQQ